MRVINFVKAFTFEIAFMAFAVGLLLIAVAKSGFWYIPNIDASRQIALNPFDNPLPGNAHYLFSNWLGPFVAWLIGATGPGPFLLFHFAFSVGFLGIFIATLYYQLPDRQARTALAIFFTLPVSTTHLYWIGLDSITLLIALLALLNHRRWPLAFGAGMALGMQHFEQSFVGFSVLTGALILSRIMGDAVNHRLSGTIATVLGILCGKAALIVIFAWSDIPVLSGRADYMTRELQRMLIILSLNMSTTLFATFGVGWFVLMRYLDRGRYCLPFVLGSLGLLLLIPFVYDNTRVFAVISFSLITAYWLWNRAWLETIEPRQIAMLIIIWLVIPWIWVWDGRPQVSTAPYNAAIISNSLFGWPDVPEIRTLWPFQRGQI